MGTSLAYLAVKGKSKDTIWKDLSLRFSKERPEGSRRSRDGICGVTLATGWYFIFDYDWNLVNNNDKLARVSTGAEVLIGSVEERVNYSMAAGWRNGSNLWTVEHDANKGEEHLLMTGSPPAAFETIRNKIQEARARTPVDERHDFYFSIPVDLFKEFTGYIYCRSILDGQPPEGELLVAI